MRFNKICLVAVLIVMAFTMTACGEDNTTELEGTWAFTRDGSILTLGQNWNGMEGRSRYTIEFNEDRFEVTEHNYRHWSNLVGWSNSFTFNVLPDHRVESSERNQRADRGDTLYYTFSISGTFSIIDDSIEFVYDDGTISVVSFRSTENTLTVGEHGNIDRDTAVLHRVQ